MRNVQGMRGPARSLERTMGSSLVSARLGSLCEALHRPLCAGGNYAQVVGREWHQRL
jgi:hypothetical protein